MIKRYFLVLNGICVLSLVLLCFYYQSQQQSRQQQLLIQQQQLHQQQKNLLKQLKQSPINRPISTLSLKNWAKQLLQQAAQANLLVKQISPGTDKLTIILTGQFSALVQWLFDINHLHFLLHYQQLEINGAQQQVQLRLSLMSKK